jgi:hypothetical protein
MTQHSNKFKYKDLAGKIRERRHITWATPLSEKIIAQIESSGRVHDVEEGNHPSPPR